MIIFLHGLDRYRILKKWKEIKNKYTHHNAGDIHPTTVDADQDSYQKFADLLKQKSFFESRRLFAVHNLFHNEDFREEFCSNIEKPEQASEIIAVFLFREQNKTNDKIKKLNKDQKTCFKKIKKHSQDQEFEPLSSKELRKWVEEQAAHHNLRFQTDQARDLFLDYNQNNLWQLEQGLNKLNGYLKEEAITEQVVKKMFSPSFETTVFEVVDAISRQDKEKSLTLINRYLQQGQNPYQLLGMIGYQIRSLIVIRDFLQQGEGYSAIVKKSNLHPYAVKKLYPQSKNFDMDRLKKIYHQLFEIDLQIKVGEIEPEFGLNLFVTKI